SPAVPAAAVRRPTRWRAGAGVAAALLVAVLVAVFMGRGGPPAAQGVAAVAPPAPVATSQPEPAVLLPMALPVSTAIASPPSTVSEIAPVAAPAPKRAARKKEAPVQAVPPAPPVPVAVAAQPAAPQGAALAATPALPDPRLQCADSSFMGRPMCIYRACQKPGMAALPLCVENNAQMQNSRKFDGF
ncbi:MAG: hypothetical protein ACK4VX_08190, partial [Polaromonas sp.]